jgi:two-component system LytT family response regulator
MAKIRVLVADDEPLARGYLRSLISPEPDCEIVAECADADATVAAVRKHDPDLVFLDIQMPGRDGFSVIEEIGSDNMPHVIFVTAHDRYAVPAFDKHALDYLLKPFSKERFEAALKRARNHLSLQMDAAWSRKLRDILHTVLDSDDMAVRPKDSIRTGRSGIRIDRLPVNSGGRVRLVKFEEIQWIQAADCYVNLHCGRETFLHRESMAALEAALDPARFIRIHRSSIVNIDAIKEIRTGPSSDYQVILKDGTNLALSRRRRKELDRLLGHAA